MIKANASFRPLGSGYTRFALPNDANAHSHGNIQIETGVPGVDVPGRFVLSGPLPADPDYRIAVIEVDRFLKPSYWDDFDFIIQDGKVEMGYNSFIDCANARVALVQAKFQAVRPASPYTVPDFGALVTVRNYGRETIRDCQFVNATTGLRAFLSTSGNVPTYKGLSFVNCWIGLHSTGSGLQLDHCTFDNTGTSLGLGHFGWRMDNTSSPDNLAQDITVKGFTEGIRYYGGPGAMLRLVHPTITQNNYAVEVSGGTLRGECGGIFHNEHGIWISGQSTLDLSNSAQLSVVDNGSTVVSGGSNPTTRLYSDNILGSDTKALNLAKGNNDFVGRDPNNPGVNCTIGSPTSFPAGSSIDASGNHWNTAGTAPTNLVVMWSSPGNNVLVPLVDPAPSSSPYCHIDPCAVPIRPDVNVECWGNDKLVTCPSCEPISTAYVTADSLHHAVLLAMSYQRKYDPNGSDFLSLKMLQAILNHPLADTSAQEAAVLEKAYSAMLQIYASSLDDSVKAQHYANRAILDQIIDRKLGDTQPDSGVYNPVFYLLMDKALAAHASGELDVARTTLAEASAQVNPVTQSYYDYWDCVLANTQDLRDSAITEYEYFDRLLTCDRPRTAGRGQHAQTADEFIREQQAKIAARRRKADLQNMLQLVPNPATADVTVTLAASALTSTATSGATGAVSLELRDLSGKSLREWQRESVPAQASRWTLPVGDLPAGVYVLRVHTASRTFTQRLVIQH